VVRGGAGKPAPSTLGDAMFLEKMIGGAFTIFVLFMLVVLAGWLIVNYPLIAFAIIYIPVILLINLWRRS
jgi:hypothetical protein